MIGNISTSVAFKNKTITFKFEMHNNMMDEHNK